MTDPQTTTKIKLDSAQRKRADELFNSWIENENCDYDAIAFEVIYLRDEVKRLKDEKENYAPGIFAAEEE